MTEPAAAEPEVFVKHKVVVPPKRSLVSEIRGVVRETFFHNVRRGDSGWFRQAGVSPRRQALEALKCVLPILDWLSSYSIRTFLHDLMAGLSTASLAIPQDLGYAPLAGIPPIYGLYSSFVPPLVYSVFGTSRNISIGPVSVVSLIMGELMKQELSPPKDAAKYLSLALTSTLFAGIFLASLGILW